MTANRVAVKGSERAPLPGSRALGSAQADAVVDVTVVLHPATDAAYPEGNSVPPQRARRSREDLATARGAQRDHLERVEQFARANNLTVVESSAARRAVVLSGTIANLSSAFGVELTDYDHPSGGYRGRTGPIYVPRDLAGVIAGVFGLDNRPQAQPHVQHGAVAETPGKPPPGAFTPPQVAKLYEFPADAQGSGQTVALIELGGGYIEADLERYFRELGISPIPTVANVSVDGARNAPTGDPASADSEVMLDIEMVGCIAPAAAIVVYFAPNTDRGFLDAITTAIHDSVSEPSVVSISWGQPEAAWTRQALSAFHQAFEDAAFLGITVCVAAGDHGSADGLTDGRAHTDYPATDPFVLACGGTTLVAASGDGIASERVWNSAGLASGGGISDVWELPHYQKSAGLPPSLNPGGHRGRGVPDVSGDADPATGYLVRVGADEFAIGGTSAVGPLWAALIALLNEVVGVSAGFVNPLLYGARESPGAFRDITVGTNDISGLGGYEARPGWDPCTGFGAPVGSRIVPLIADTFAETGPAD